MYSDKRSSIKDVARIAGVSTATVSHVINRTRYVSDSVKQRVYAAMDEVEYYPNLLARSLRNQETRTIGVVIPDISNFYYTGVAEAIERTLKESGYHMVLSNSYDDIQTERTIVQLYNSLQISGLIMVPAIGSQKYLKSLVRDRYPVVFADRRPSEYYGDCVILENTRATNEAIKLLLDRGYRKVALILGDMRLSTTQDRIQGYKEALAEYGVEYDSSLVMEGKFTFDSGYQVVKGILKKGRADALFFANDSATIGGIKALNEAGVKIPSEMAIISCNDFMWTEIVSPAITVVSQPSSQLGRAAASTLIDRICADKHDDYLQLTVPTQIIIRQSC